jgi:RNA polymerase sigma-70 factor (ECF subfamily)
MEHTDDYKKDIRLLVMDLQQGHKEAFDYLFCTYYKDLCHFASTFVGSMATAEDVVQDFFIRIWEAGVHIDRHTSLESYLYVAVRNRCVSHIRGRKRHVGIEALTGRAAENTNREDVEEWNFVWKVVEGLPTQCKIILKLVVVEEMKYAEVAERLNISLNTVKTQLKIAYRVLREKL